MCHWHGLWSRRGLPAVGAAPQALWVRIREAHPAINFKSDMSERILPFNLVALVEKIRVPLYQSEMDVIPMSRML